MRAGSTGSYCLADNSDAEAAAAIAASSLSSAAAAAARNPLTSKVCQGSRVQTVASKTCVRSRCRTQRSLSRAATLKQPRPRTPLYEQTGGFKIRALPRATGPGSKGTPGTASRMKTKSRLTATTIQQRSNRAEQYVPASRASWMAEAEAATSSRVERSSSSPLPGRTMQSETHPPFETSI